jgi:hypothetical protein
VPKTLLFGTGGIVHKRSFWNAYAGAAFNGIGIAQVRASRGISGFGLTVCSKLDARG